MRAAFERFSRLQRVRWLVTHFRQPGDALLVASILPVAMAVPLLMRVPMRYLGVLLGSPRSAARDDASALARVQRAIEFVLNRGRPLVRPGCLTRGVTRCFFLRRAGLDVDLCFGMGVVDNVLAGHCWLELDGAPYLENHDPRAIFTEMYRIPSKSTYRWHLREIANGPERHA